MIVDTTVFAESLSEPCQPCALATRCCQLAEAQGPEEVTYVDARGNSRAAGWGFRCSVTLRRMSASSPRNAENGYSENAYYEWARQAVEGLRWLVHLDDEAFGGDRAPLAGFDADAVDAAHVRWATSTAITAIDLCSTALAARHGSHKLSDQKALALHRNYKDLLALPLTPDERAWLEAVKADRDYEIVRQARHPLTHALLVRTAHIRVRPPTGHAERSAFELVHGRPVADRPQARDLILKAYSVADRHVRAFRR